MITAVRLELSYAEDNMGAAFSKGITNYQNHQKVLNYELADLGARLVRLELNEERLSSQKLNVQNQKSANEEIDVAAVAVQLKEAAGVKTASAEPNRKKVGQVTWDQVKAIAQDKMPDLNCFTLESAMRMVAGTARSMGLNVVGEFPEL